MSYEAAIATKVLNTNCCACGLPLVDAVSVDHGMGPDCRKRYMVPASPDQEANRPAANAIVYAVWEVLKRCYPGYAGVNQHGEPFVVPVNDRASGTQSEVAQ